MKYIGNEEEYECIALGYKFHVTKIVPLGHYCGMFMMYDGMPSTACSTKECRSSSRPGGGK